MPPAFPEITSLAERHLPHSRFFTPARADTTLTDFLSELPLVPGETLFGSWRADGLTSDETIFISTHGLRGESDYVPTFLPYAEISDLRMPDANDPADKNMHEIMLFTMSERCIFFPLFGSERDFQQASILFHFLSSVVGAHAKHKLIEGFAVPQRAAHGSVELG